MTSKTNYPTTLKKPIEQQLARFLSITMAVLLLLTLWIMHLLSLSTLVQITLLIAIFTPLSIVFISLYKQMMLPFFSLTNVVESIRLEDYSLQLKDNYQDGVIKLLMHEITALSDDLQQRKQTYNQNYLLIYHLIEQLDAPIAIFNEQNQLTHANNAFSQYIEKPWQTVRLSHCEKSGLSFNNGWYFTDSFQEKIWQLKSSQFIENDSVFHLVILTNIENLLRVNQQKSWQQIIRVLSHEIHNSLTPIKSLTQSLISLEKQQSPSLKALHVILDRSNSLQEFVDRYSNIGKRFAINKTRVNATHFVDSVVALFPNKNIVVNNKIEHLYGDLMLLKQVLINLVKNALESNPESPELPIEITLIEQKNHHRSQIIITVKDCGLGISNIENLFVPFYTTKSHGHGIGLGFCKNIIEQHNGQITLENNLDAAGATATIFLPSSTNR